MPRQPELTRSTRSARSSTRACRSASSSPSIRSSRRIAWLSRPRISATCAARPGAPRCAGRRERRRRPGPASTPRAPAAASASASICSRERSSAASRIGRLRAVPRPRRRFAAWPVPERASSMGAEATLHAGGLPILDYDLPPELIAQTPAEPGATPRGCSSTGAATGEIEHRVFSELPELLGGELVVVNDTRVVPARLRLRRATGGSVEVLLVEERGGRPVGGASSARRAACDAGERLGPGRARRAARGRALARPARRRAERRGAAPAVHPRALSTIPSATRRCTRESPGSAAAPTAGLHLTPELARPARPGRRHAPRRARHVPAGVAVRRVEDHELHGERYAVAAAAWDRIAARSACSRWGRRRCESLETVARTGELSGSHRLFVTPGFEFRRVDALLTNFHLPRSTLLALVMAFAGVEETRALYRDGDRGALPLLLLRRRDARALNGLHDGRHASGTISCPMRAQFPSRLEVGGGEGWPQATASRFRARSERAESRLV